MPADRRPATEDDEFNWADRAGALHPVTRRGRGLWCSTTPSSAGCPLSRCASRTPTGRGTGGQRRTVGSSRWRPPADCRSTSRVGPARWSASRTPPTRMLLAAEKGRNGERYIISERFISVRELYETAADATGVRPPRFGVPLWAMYLMGYAGDVARDRASPRLPTVEFQRAADAHLADAGPREGLDASWAGSPSRSTKRSAGQRISFATTESDGRRRDGARRRKTGSGLRVPAGDGGSTIEMCLNSSR